MLLEIGAQYMTVAFPHGPRKAFALKRTMQGKFPLSYLSESYVGEALPMPPCRLPSTSCSVPVGFTVASIFKRHTT